MSILGVAEGAEVSVSRDSRSCDAPDEVLGVSVAVPAWDTTLWLVGAHGGAGESRLAELDPRWLAAGHGWPPAEERATAVVVARTDERGLRAAQRAARQWESGLVPGVRLAGLVVMADAPGRLPRPLRELADRVAGAFEACWRVPWIGAWRTGDAADVPALTRVVAALNGLPEQEMRRA